MAGGRGGHTTKFDINSYGGNWTCIGTAGACGAGFTQYFNATCNGVADDGAAFSAWYTYGVAQGNAPAKLFIPPGFKCNVTNSFLTWDNNLSDPSILQPIIWGYGATVTPVFIGGSGTPNGDFTLQALIQQANVNDTSVTLITASDGSRFSIGDNVLVGGLYMQCQSYPQNLFFYEYGVVTNKTGSVGSPPVVLTLGNPLRNQYLTTWPKNAISVSCGTTGYDDSGPATIFKLYPSWPNTIQVFGLQVKNTNISTSVVGKTVVLTDVTFDGGFAPTMGMGHWCFFCTLGPKNFSEIDKLLDLVYFYRVNMPNTQLINFSTQRNLIIESSNIGSVNLTMQNTTIRNSKIGSLSLGAGFGHTVSTTLDSSNIGTLQCSNTAVPAASLSFSNGTFSIGNGSAGDQPGVVQTFVPGQKYFFGTYDGAIHSLGHIFTVTGLRQDASNVFVDTDIGVTLPSVGQTNYFQLQAPNLTANFMTGTSTPNNTTGISDWCQQ